MPTPTLLVIAAMLTLIGVSIAVLWIQHVRQNTRLERMQRQLDVFIDTSINLARNVDRMTLGESTQEQLPVASRRWRISEAKKRLAGGDQLLDISQALGLSRDETSLLRVARN